MSWWSKFKDDALGFDKSGGGIYAGARDVLGSKIADDALGLDPSGKGAVGAINYAPEAALAAAAFVGSGGTSALSMPGMGLGGTAFGEGYLAGLPAIPGLTEALGSTGKNVLPQAAAAALGGGGGAATNPYTDPSNYKDTSTSGTSTTTQTTTEQNLTPEQQQLLDQVLQQQITSLNNNDVTKQIEASLQANIPKIVADANYQYLPQFAGNLVRTGTLGNSAAQQLTRRDIQNQTSQDVNRLVTNLVPSLLNARNAQLQGVKDLFGKAITAGGTTTQDKANATTGNTSNNINQNNYIEDNLRTAAVQELLKQILGG